MLDVRLIITRHHDWMVDKVNEYEILLRELSLEGDRRTKARIAHVLEGVNFVKL